jgi:hypothetical protein
MQKMIKIIFTLTVLLVMSSVVANASIVKGQKLYLKKLKSSCHINGAIMSAKHSISEWENLYESDELAVELKRICPKVKDTSLKEKFLPHYFDFFKEYANDSGNIPSC